MPVGGFVQEDVNRLMEATVWPVWAVIFNFVVTFIPLQVVAVVVVVVVACVADAVSIQCCHKAVVEKQTRLECSVRLAFAGDSRCRHRLAPICFGAWRQITAAFEPVGLCYGPLDPSTMQPSVTPGFKVSSPQRPNLPWPGTGIAGACSSPL